jgi:hypothetical protein
MMSAIDAAASPIAATPCASGASIERGAAAMRPFLQTQAGAPQAAGMVLLDCIVEADRRLSCQAPHQTPSQYDLSGAALAFARELEVCPGTQRHLMFPLVIRAEDARPPPSP